MCAPQSGRMVQGGFSVSWAGPGAAFSLLLRLGLFLFKMAAPGGGKNVITLLSDVALIPASRALSLLWILPFMFLGNRVGSLNFPLVFIPRVSLDVRDPGVGEGKKEEGKGDIHLGFLPRPTWKRAPFLIFISACKGICADRSWLRLPGFRAVRQIAYWQRALPSPGSWRVAYESPTLSLSCLISAYQSGFVGECQAHVRGRISVRLFRIRA
jgi:hypothetical protein